MNQSFQRTSGICLIIGALLLTLTMILHPNGGSIEHILQIAQMNMVAHSLAIASLPLLGFGYYGLAMSLLMENRLSILALLIAALGLVAGLIAGTINGLTLTLFLQRSSEDIQNRIEVVEAIMRYGFSINRPMDYILMGAMLLSMGLWSVLMLRSTLFPRWLGYLGLGLLIMGGIGFAMRFDYIHVDGFRIFIFGLVSWIISTGVQMSRK